MIGERLKIGDTIGVICPASGERNPIMDRNLNQLKNLGFKVKEGVNLRKCDEFLAGNDKERANDFMEMFKDSQVKAIVCYRGGYGSIRMMRYVDWKVINKNPKIFCGYSDITLLLNYINKVSNLITFHSPMVNSNLSNSLTKDYFLNVLMGTSNSPYINLKDFSSIKIYNKSLNTLKGKLCGGNLSMICSAIGTPYDINTKDRILLIEDIDEENYAIDRLLTQLSLSNKLSSCKGFILGHFTPSNLNTEKVILDTLLSLNKPIITGLPFGHDYPNITLPIGANVSIDCNNNTLNLNEAIVK